VIVQNNLEVKFRVPKPFRFSTRFTKRQPAYVVVVCSQAIWHTVGYLTHCRLSHTLQAIWHTVGYLTHCSVTQNNFHMLKQKLYCLNLWRHVDIGLNKGKRALGRPSCIWKSNTFLGNTLGWTGSGESQCQNMQTF